jgi:predicted  nucleic acid-binding Zn-ribbon protein
MFDHERRENHEERRQTALILAAIEAAKEEVMSTVQNLTAAVDELTRNEAALAGELQPLADAVTALEAAYTALKNSTNLSPDDQAALDAAVQGVTDASTAVANAAAAVSADTPPPPA